MKAYERDSNYLRAHGSYMEDWCDAEGAIWRHVMPVSQTVAQSLLTTAFMAQELRDGHDTYISQLRQEREHDYMLWLRVGNKDIVVYHVDNGKVFALTNRDGRLYVITGDYRRIERYAATRQPFLDCERRLLQALAVAEYDMHDDELHLRCLF